MTTLTPSEETLAPHESPGRAELEHEEALTAAGTTPESTAPTEEPAAVSGSVEAAENRGANGGQALQAVDTEPVEGLETIRADTRPSHRSRRPVWIGLAVVLVLVAGLVGGFFYLRGQEASFVEAGDQALAAEDWAGARAAYDMALAVEPEAVQILSSEAIKGRGIALFHLGEPEAAAADLTAALELDPTLDAHRAYRALLWFDHGQESQALSESDLVVESSGLDDELKLALRWARLHYFYTTRADFPAALAEGEKLLVLDAKAGLPYALRAWQHYQAQELDQALENARKSLGYDADLGLAYRVRGSLSAFHFDIQSSMADLNQAVKLDENDYHALAMRAFVYLLDENHEAAQADVQKAANLSANAPVVLWAQGLEKLYLHDEASAASLIDKAIQSGDERPEYLWARGQAYTLVADQASRTENFTRAVQIQPDFAPALLSLAYDRLSLYDKTNLEEDAELLIEALPTSCSPHLLLAQYYAWQRDEEHSQAALAKAAELEPDHSQVEILLGRADVKQSAYDEALRHFQRALDLHAGSLPALEGKGRVYLAQKDFTAAREQAEKMLALHSDDIPARVLLAEIALAEGDPGAALEKLQEAAVFDPNHLDMLLVRAEAYRQAADPVKGLLDITLLLEWAPLHAQAHVVQGEFYLLQDDLVQARRAADKALKIDPQNPDAYQIFLEAAIRKEDWTNVRLYARKLLEMGAKGARVYEGLSIAYYEEGNNTKALEYGKQALELDKTLEQINSRFVDLYWRRGEVEQAQEHAQLVVDFGEDDELFASAEAHLAFLKKIPRVQDGKRSIKGWEEWPVRLTYASDKWVQVPSNTESVMSSGIRLVPTDQWKVDTSLWIMFDTLERGWKLDIYGTVRYWVKKYREWYGSDYTFIRQAPYRFPGGPGALHEYKLKEEHCQEYWFAEYQYQAWENYYMGAGFCTDPKDFKQVSAEVDKLFETLRINP